MPYFCLDGVARADRRGWFLVPFFLFNWLTVVPYLM